MTKEKREKKEVSSDGLLLRGEHMEISMNSLLYSFLWSIVLGAFLGVAYDIVRISRVFIGVEYGNNPFPYEKIKLPIISKLKKEKKCNKRRASSVALNIFIFAGDILFCVFTALALVIYIYHSNEGKARWMVFFGAAIGFFAYYFSIGKLVVLFSQYIVFVIRAIISYTVFFVSLPIKALILLCLRFYARITERIYTKIEMKKIRKASKSGFIG